MNNQSFVFFGQKMTIFSFLFWSGFLMALGGLTVATAAGFFGHLDWYLDLLSHLRLQYLVAAALLLIIALWNKKPWLSGASAAIGLANLAVLLPFFALTPTADADGDTLRVLFGNVSHENETPEQVMELVRETDPDIIFFSEMTEAHQETMAELWELYPHTTSDGITNFLLSRLPIESSFILIDQPYEERPTIFAQLNHEGQQLTIVGIHTQRPTDRLHWQLRNEQFQEIAMAVQQETNPVIAIGGLNVSPYSPNFSEFLEAGGFQDGRLRQGINGTWPNLNPLLRIPIYHFIATPEVAVQRLETRQFDGSDHRPLVADFAVTTVE